MKSRFRTILVLAAVLAAPGCVAPRVQSAPQPTAEAFQTLISDRLYFGRNIPGGGVVSESDWERFLGEVITPRFPAGLTVLRSLRQWRDTYSIVQIAECYIHDFSHPDYGSADHHVCALLNT